MCARDFWRAVTLDRADMLGRFLALLDEAGVRYCLIGGQGVNAYVEPVVTLDLDVVIAAPDLEAVLPRLAETFRAEHLPSSINLSAPDSDLRIQIQTDPRDAPFVERA